MDKIEITIDNRVVRESYLKYAEAVTLRRCYPGTNDDRHSICSATLSAQKASFRVSGRQAVGIGDIAAARGTVMHRRARLRIQSPPSVLALVIADSSGGFENIKKPSCAIIEYIESGFDIDKDSLYNVVNGLTRRQSKEDDAELRSILGEIQRKISRK